jgi:hypothetical protein
MYASEFIYCLYLLIHLLDYPFTRHPYSLLDSKVQIHTLEQALTRATSINSGGE